MRLDRLDWTRLAWLLALSALIHLAAWGGYEAGKKLGIWDKLHLPAWARTINEKIVRNIEQPKSELPDQQPPLVFVEVNPMQATPEPPKNARYYSSRNSQAANPDTDKDTGVPKITGEQTHVAKAEDVRRNDLEQLHPTPPQPAQPMPKAKPKVEMGDLALAKPQPNPSEEQGESEQSKPRTLVEALSRQQLNRIPGQKMKQEGGVRRHSLVASFDAKATPFGAYDAAFIEAVSQRWYDLLDSRNYAQDRRGHVRLRFDLNYDGRITDVKILETTVDDTLAIICEKAVRDPSPYERWPSDMRRMIGKDYRQITFTFYYN